MDTDRRNDLDEPDPTTQARWFATTHWSVVLLSARPDAAQACKALDELCRTYWLPLYSFIRRQGYGPHDAQDLTQGFFVRLLRMNSLADVHPAKGKFRSFLLVALKHFLSDERDRARAEKRGGGEPIFSIDQTEAEERYQQLPSTDLSPETAFDRRWALTALDEAFNRLRREYETSRRAALFESLRGFLSSETAAGDYSSVASKIGMSASAVAVAVHRLRQRYRECVRLELAQTVATPKDLEEEMNYLLSLLRK